MFDFAPHLVLIVHVVVQFHHHDTHAVLTLCGGFYTVHLTIRKEVTFQRTGHLLFHLLAGGTRIYCHYHTLTDSGMGEFVLRHNVHAIDAHHKQYADDEQCYRVMLQRPSEPTYLFHFTISLFYNFTI